MARHFLDGAEPPDLEPSYPTISEPGTSDVLDGCHAPLSCRAERHGGQTPPNRWPRETGESQTVCIDLRYP